MAAGDPEATCAFRSVPLNGAEDREGVERVPAVTDAEHTSVCLEYFEQNEAELGVNFAEPGGEFWIAAAELPVERLESSAAEGMAGMGMDADAWTTGPEMRVNLQNDWDEYAGDVPSYTLNEFDDEAYFIE
ncbi:hypothetical protein ENKNEFLB_02102 [Nocardioides aquaticus]|uniref:Uncharacterized protein n=1 Tax=Nocardioides aquaticus TaxID=160826 RepID=A0ABX8EKT0_9ACTN|nr:hypothetical protein [Nocardioides aquaticus]QVT79712.1 hypothetical protein ENKNEFLB_02102 [Nocardioides aquaticus]